MIDVDLIVYGRAHHIVYIYTCPADKQRKVVLLASV